MASSWYTLLALLLSSAAVGFAGTLCTRAEMAEENLKKLAIANNDLALNIHRQLASGSSENIFFSPLSLSTAFGMLYYGTKGNTAEELRKALGYETGDLQEGLVHETFRQYLAEYLPSKDASSYVLNSANAVLVDKRLDLIPSYKQDVQDLYQASVRDVDFVREAHQVVTDINEWVKEKTNGKIEKLFDDLDSSTVLVLLNAVYFKGTWKTQFESQNTTLGAFYNNGQTSNAKEVPMMRLKSKFLYTAVHDVEALEMPYKGENVSMVVLLPNKRDGLEALEKSLTLEKLSVIRKQLYNTKVLVSMPKFKIEYSKEMSNDFKSIGAKSVFSPDADFSGITSNPNVFVNQVLHKAILEVNEEGSEAAAVTGIYSFRSRLPIFTVDHPFLFAIVDKRNDMILFVGRVTNLKVPMMRLTSKFPYTVVHDVQALEMPYKGENVSMVVLLPTKRDGLEALEKSITLEKLSVIRKQLYNTKVEVTMPKFKIEYSKEMSNEFKSIGAKNVFSPEADFSGITSNPNIFVTQVLHKAIVEVNEEGSEAAAVTGIVSNRMRPIVDYTPVFTVDHPFLFAIVDKRNDMILFVGRVTNL